jgi:hypothetical protein
VPKARMTTGRVAAGLSAALAIAGASIGDAGAQGWGSGWGNSGWGNSGWNSGWGQQSSRRDYSRSYESRDDQYGREYAPRQQRGYGSPDYAPRDGGEQGEGRSSSSHGGGSGVLCVRLCDGRHFPIPRVSQGAALNTTKVCNALCPAAKTQVFNGSSPESAVASDGTRYASLANAFVFREKIVPSCSCTGHGPGGLAQIDIESDPTLRAGDIVATRGGLTVFRGSGSFPYKVADFTPLQSYAKANDEIRRKLSNVRVDVTARAVTPVPRLATAEDEKPTGKTRSRRQRAVIDANRRDARASFDGWFR